MRGKGGASRPSWPPAGITPAYAGKRVMRRRSFAVLRDHPRVCGEKFGISCNPSPTGGSPPRMRGKGMYAVHPARAWGITPAYAGKSTRPCSSIVQYGDHPRVCGEKRPVRRGACSGLGSPPRMRGKAPAGNQQNRQGGITPAYAGKSDPLNADELAA